MSVPLSLVNRPQGTLVQGYPRGLGTVSDSVLAPCGPRPPCPPTSRLRRLRCFGCDDGMKESVSAPTERRRAVRAGALAGAALAGVVVRDLRQRQHAIIRNFPVVGHFR